MSNPAVCFLANTMINDIYFGIEDNLGESIHIHYGSLRVALSLREFLKFASKVEESAKNLFEMQGLPWEEINEESVKAEWVTNYKNIGCISEKLVRLDELFMKESYVHERSIKKIIPVRESGYIRLLNNSSDDVAYYMEQGQYEPSRKEKVDKIVDLIREKGYPFEGKKIVIDQQGYILDGIKRASSLYFLYGGNIKIPVTEIDIQWDKSLEERKLIAEKQIEEFLINRKFKKNEAIEEVGVNYRYSFKQLIQYFDELNLKYIVIRWDKKTQTGESVYAEIIVENENLHDLLEQIDLVKSQKHVYENYQYLYAVERPLSCVVKEGNVLVGNKVCVKSKFNRQIMPMEKTAEQWVIENKVFDEKNNCWRINEQAMLFIKIVDCMLEKENFTNEDRKFITDHIGFLSDRKFCDLLDKEFFSYTEKLVCYLKHGEYDRALQEYVTNIHYLLE